MDRQTALNGESHSDLMNDLIQPVAELRNCKTVVHGVNYSEQESPLFVGSGH